MTLFTDNWRLVLPLIFGFLVVGGALVHNGLFVLFILCSGLPDQVFLPEKHTVALMASFLGNRLKLTVKEDDISFSDNIVFAMFHTQKFILQKALKPYKIIQTLACFRSSFVR